MEGVPIEWVAGLCGAVAAGYPLLWKFFTGQIDKLQARIAELSDRFQDTIIAREDQCRAEKQAMADRHAAELSAIREGLSADIRAMLNHAE